MSPTATAVEVLPGYRLAIGFADGTSGVVDCAPWLYERDADLLVQLRDPARFAEVRINPELGFIEWPNGMDVCPDLLYEEAHRTSVG
jgi:hypothetical protein